MKRKVAVFTGNRAEYGLQKPILRALKEMKEVEYQLIVSGAHLDPKFGQTFELIKKDGFQIHASPKIDLEMDDLFSTARAIGVGVVAMVETYRELRPDIVVVYADRFEGFAAVIAASQAGIPVAHIEGGDLTDGGALDDSIRHAMTKLSHLHFTTNQDAYERVLSLGEEKWRVFNFGLPALDMILNGEYASPLELTEKFNLNLNKPVIVFTQHSVTTEFTEAADQFSHSLSALIRLANEGVQVLITYPNNDAGGLKLIQQIEELNNRKIAGIQVHQSLGSYNYYGVLSLRKNGYRVVCAGNSSSGIKETPAFGCPTVNIGTRQNGRLRGGNVIDVDYNSDAIYAAVKRGLYDDKFIHHCENSSNPYGSGNSGQQIAHVLASVNLDKKLLNKKMMN